jgi:hypothetical protein
MRRKTIVFTAFCLLIGLSYGCNTDNHYQKELKNFIGQQFIIPDDALLINKNHQSQIGTYAGSKYEVVAYLDSLALCSECWIGNIILIQQLLSQCENKDVAFLPIFHSEDVFNIKKMMDEIGFEQPYYVDVNGSVKESNKQFPSSEILKTFLLKDSKVIVVGSPVRNERLRKLYLSTLGKSKR